MVKQRKKNNKKRPRGKGFKTYGPGFEACLRLNIQGREKAFAWPHLIWLDDIKGYVLLFLSVSSILLAVKIGTIGLKNMLDSMPKGLYKCGAISRYLPSITGIPIRGQSTYTAKPMTIISRILAGMPYRKNSPGVNCLES